MPRRRDIDREIDRRLTGEHIIEKGEILCRIILEPSSGHLRCLVPGCDFHIHVAAAPVPVMCAELRDFYSDHRKHRHPEYKGRTGYDYQMGDRWKLPIKANGST